MPSQLADELWAAGVCGRAGLLPLARPAHLLATARLARRYGSFGAPVATAALRFGDRMAVVDEQGGMTFAELDDRSSRLCNAWREAGLRPGGGVALLARNHRGFLEASYAAFKAGARLVLLSTDFAGPQLREVGRREGVDLLVSDSTFDAEVEGVNAPLGRFHADALDAVVASGSSAAPPAPDVKGRLVLLTSGTTGLPKGAGREAPTSLVPTGSFIDKVPFRARETTVLAIPLFHALGFAHVLIATGLGCTMVMRPRFRPDVTARVVQDHQATAMVVVPTMLRRILDFEDVDDFDLGSLRIVFVAGSQLGADLATRAQRRLGPVVYNLYGSTEVSVTTIATPEELAAAPDCVGTPPRGTSVRLYDGRDCRVEQSGVTGRIFARTGAEFEGYTGGGGKAVIDGYMATGDVGHLDAAGRLYIDGRDDDMIVSGGENLYPDEIEELLNSHPGIVEAAVIGVPDDEFGARLRAFVVRRDGASIDEDAVKQHVRDHLARYKVPRDVVFMTKLPRNPTGKVLKRELPSS